MNPIKQYSTMKIRRLVFTADHGPAADEDIGEMESIDIESVDLSMVIPKHISATWFGGDA